MLGLTFICICIWNRIIVPARLSPFYLAPSDRHPVQNPSYAIEPRFKTIVHVMAYCVWKRGPDYWNSWISDEQSALQISSLEAYRHVLRPHKENDASITFCSRSYHEHRTSHCLLKSAHAWHVKWRLIMIHFVARNCANRNWTETVDHFGRSALCNLLCFL